jgi:hypothetical protein
LKGRSGTADKGSPGKCYRKAFCGLDRDENGV